MRKMPIRWVLFALAIVSICGMGYAQAPTKEAPTVVVKWLASRPLGGAIDTTVRELAQQYSKEHGGNFKLEVETTADRPSYLQKLKVLVAGGNMPDIIDIDADPYCKQLVDAGMLVDVKRYLQNEGKYSGFQPIALKYQEFVDGTMYTLPLEYHVEMIWYNKAIFAKYQLTVPKTIDEWLKVCDVLQKNGVTPISVDGIDRWPVLRYLAMLPFRQTGNDYIISLRDGKTSLGDKVGRPAVEFMQRLGKYFNKGFAATDYATAQSMFLDGKSAMYYIGDWEQTAMYPKYSEGKVDYFYLPASPGAVTKPNEFGVVSGIGMAFNSNTFDKKTKSFINYLIDNYGKIYAGKQQMSPLKNSTPQDAKFTSLYLRIQDDMNKVGTHFMKPWDTFLDPDSNQVLGDNLLLLASGDLNADEFIKRVDAAIKANKN